MDCFKNIKIKYEIILSDLGYYRQFKERQIFLMQYNKPKHRYEECKISHRGKLGRSFLGLNLQNLRKFSSQATISTLTFSPILVTRKKNPLERMASRKFSW